MSRQQSEFSQDIYHRIYRLTKRNVRPPLIAATLGLPLEAVQNIVTRLRSPVQEPEEVPETRDFEPEESGELFLDVILMPKSRYAVLDISGMPIEHLRERMESELNKALNSTWKAVALKVSDVERIDTTGVGLLLKFHKDFTRKGRYTALLDPSPAVEKIIQKEGLDEHIPIFGTERSFEDHAFSS